MSAPNGKIGVLDSGIGGLSVLQHIHQHLPAYPTLYIADQAHLPYGPRPAREIDTFVDAMACFLIEQGAAVVVLACHAASAASLYELRERYPQIPFVGIEPAIKPAAEHSRTNVIGVLTTQATADGPLYRRVLDRFAYNTRVLTQVAPELVLLAEQGEVQSPEVQAAVRKVVQPLVAAGADHLVLACTHFPFLASVIQEVAGPSIALIDPGPAVARQVARVWPAAVVPASGPNRYFTTGDAAGFRTALHRLIGVDGAVSRLDWDTSGDKARLLTRNN